MAPSRNLPDSDASSMVDTPMTDGNESVARIPVDEPDYPMAVSPSRGYQPLPRVLLMTALFQDYQDTPDYTV